MLIIKHRKVLADDDLEIEEDIEMIEDLEDLDTADPKAEENE